MQKPATMLADCAHILTTIGRSLIARRSRYAAVLQALIVIAGESRIDVAKVPPVKERTETLDRDWIEEPAFAGAPGAADPLARQLLRPEDWRCCPSIT